MTKMEPVALQKEYIALQKECKEASNIYITFGNLGPSNFERVEKEDVNNE